MLSLGCLLVGASLLAAGVWMAVTGNTGLMHGYHLVGVLPDDRRRLGRATGLGVCVLAVAVALLAVVLRDGATPEPTDPLVVAMLALLVVGLVGSVGPIVWFQFVRPLWHLRWR